ncbi:SCO family protein [Rufibacter roseus]|uniref:SCO family protein n=1 Tax=Rufibacter roseus TaxID=1567108 RepID=A0ABW2DM56_9BACT|nr:SCO family protein [Rufibacter roseus]
MKKLLVYAAFGLAIFSACTSEPQERQLPILGPRTPDVKMVEGKPVVDTIYHTIPDFAFLDQDSQWVTPKTVEGKIYVADFFFTSCPSICPKMKSQMLRVYEKFKGNPNVALLSHSIDPRHDTVAVLRDYADRLGVKSDTWHFLTGDRDSIMDLAQKHYFVTAMQDESVPGGFEHTDGFLLIDEQRRIRGHYHGLDEEDVDRLMQDMELLLAEQKNKNGQGKK